MTASDNAGRLSKRHLVLILLAALVIVVAVARLGGSPEEEQSPVRRVPVEVVEVGTRDLEETVRGIGTLRAPAEVELSPEVAGRVQALRFEEGGAVEEGEVLVQLDAGKARSQLSASQAALEEARVRVSHLERRVERQEKLVEQALVSEEAFEQVRTELESAGAEVDRLEAEVAITEEELQDTTIRAPFSGSISERLVDSGAFVSPGDPLARLYQLDPLELSFSVPERFAGRIEQGQPVSVSTAAFADVNFRGEVSFVSPSIDEDTRTLNVKALVPNPELKLKPGAFATALVTVGLRENRPVVPSDALVATRSGYMVFLIEDGRAVSRMVETGLRQEDQVEITEGLSPGERIVRSGHMSLDPGTPVEIANDPASQGQ